MSPDAHANFAASTVAVAPSPAASGLSLTVQAGDGALFPPAPFNGVLCPAGVAPRASNAEIVRVSAVAGDVMTIARAQESTSARTALVGDQFFAAITKKTLTDAEPVNSGLQSGVLLATDCALSGAAISSAGVITGTLAAASPLWVTMPSGVLIPLAFPGGALSFTPATKPASGQYRGYGIEIGSDGTVTLATGSADQASLALALANINTVPAAGKVRVADIVMLNTAGTYSLPASATRDRRPWARGGYSRIVRTAGNYTTTSTSLVAIDATNLAIRMETQGILRAWLRGAMWGPTGNWTAGFQVDGATVDPATAAAPLVQYGAYSTDITFAQDLILAAGSHLIVPVWSTPSGTLNLSAYGGVPAVFLVEELLKVNANNGTA